MNLLVVDVGNSSCKLCCGPINDKFPDHSFRSISLAELGDEMSILPGPALCIVSSVDSSATKKLNEILRQYLEDDQLVFLSSKNAPLPLLVENPDTLGADRIAAAYEAYRRLKSQTIIIDCGTATTVDLVDDSGNFRGGTIFPGIQISLDVLAKKTDRLPLLDLPINGISETLGNNTLTAIQSGVFWSQVGGVEKITKNLQNQFGEATILVTGGRGQAVLESSELKGDYTPTLVLEGLWHYGVETVA